VARALIVGCGCRGRELGAQLGEREWQVRGTSRSVEGVAAIEAAGLDAAAADPERPGTVLELCGDVTVVVWLLGSARGAPEAIAAIHGPRLERLLEKLVDSPVRGFAYEASGGVEESRLRGGRAIVERAAETWRIPVIGFEGDRGANGWAERTASAVARLVGG
jgi:nucleoside-diphosphate-sugar epimerase